MASRREEMIAENEAVFRGANERMTQWEEQHATSAVELYFCECANPECHAKVELTKPDYERIRSDSRHFVVVPGHEVPDVETVIERNDGWWIIEKAPEMTETVEALDPRRDD